MPVLKHAKKKLRQDRKRALRNKTVRNLFKSLIKKAKANPTTDAVNAAFKSIDKAAKNNLIHNNKAARLKSGLSKISVGQVETAPGKKKTTKQKSTAKKKTAAKSRKKATKKS